MIRELYMPFVDGNSIRISKSASGYKRLHEWIIKRPHGMVTDHINEDGHDNRRCNLDICTSAENTRRYYRRRHEEKIRLLEGREAR